MICWLFSVWDIHRTKANIRNLHLGKCVEIRHNRNDCLHFRWIFNTVIANSLLVCQFYASVLGFYIKLSTKSMHFHIQSAVYCLHTFTLHTRPCLTFAMAFIAHGLHLLYHPRANLSYSDFDAATLASTAGAHCSCFSTSTRKWQAIHS